MAKTQEERFEAIAKGQMAAFLQNQLADIVIDREAEVLNALINAFNGGRLTNEMMLAGIARISELRKIMGDLERQANKGIHANEIEKNGFSPDSQENS